jgi:hypothetical protein
MLDIQDQDNSLMAPEDDLDLTSTPLRDAFPKAMENKNRNNKESPVISDNNESITDILKEINHPSNGNTIDTMVLIPQPSPIHPPLKKKSKKKPHTPCSCKRRL